MTTKQKEFPLQITSASLHILAMALMLLDHVWGTLMADQDWMTCIGRMAFPIFAFLLVEGYFHTHSVKKYALRLLIGAAISEIPFDLMHEGMVFNPFHQNVLWLFLIALLGIHLMENIRKKGKLWLTILVDILVVAVCYLLGFLSFADYFGPGILMVFVFYFFRGRKWWCFLGQFILMCWINLDLMGGRTYPLILGDLLLELPQQGFALLALFPLWFYRGKQGHHSRPFQYFCYGFYPVHALLLYLLAYVILPRL